MLVKVDLGEVILEELSGKCVIFNIFLFIDMDICVMFVCKFNEEVFKLENIQVICVFVDFLFVVGCFCGVEGIENVIIGLMFCLSFGEDYGVIFLFVLLIGLLFCSVVVIDVDGSVFYIE